MESRDFYRTDWLAQAIVDQSYHRYVTVRFKNAFYEGMRRHYTEMERAALVTAGSSLWCKDVVNPFFEIHKIGEMTSNDPTDFLYFVRKGAMEFIPEVSTIFDIDRTDTIIIDLDPKDPELFPLDAVRGATKAVFTALCVPGCHLRSVVKVEGWKFRFSGNRSFHIYIKLDKPHDFIELREAVKKSLNVVTEMYPQLSYKNVRTKQGEAGRTDYILIDIGALARHRCVRALWSLHAKTGQVCVPVTDIDKFLVQESVPHAVLTAGPRSEEF